jgi:phosphatidylserine decarboxylase
MFVHTLWGILLSLAVTLPLAWKWQLGVFRVACVVSALAVGASVVVTQIRAAMEAGVLARSVLVSVIAVVGAGGILLYRFHRDPERTPPSDDRLIVSPADGVVIYVNASERGMLPSSNKNGRHYSLAELTKTSLRENEAVVIGISMSFLDVHVNRAPMGGQVTFQTHFPGLFGSLRQAEMVLRNERATTVIERDQVQVAVVQIASRLVRQIVSYVRAGQTVGLGQRIGVIRFGSQVDIVLPARSDLHVAVRPGQRVRAGESILAEFERPKVAQ